MKLGIILCLLKMYVFSFAKCLVALSLSFFLFRSRSSLCILDANPTVAVCCKYLLLFCTCCFIYSVFWGTEIFFLFFFFFFLLNEFNFLKFSLRAVLGSRQNFSTGSTESFLYTAGPRPAPQAQLPRCGHLPPEGYVCYSCLTYTETSLSDFTGM